MSLVETDEKVLPHDFEPALRAWLLEADRLEEAPEQLLHGLVTQFRLQGVSLISLSVLVRTLHPQFEMLGQRWRPFELDEIPVQATERVAGQRQVPGPDGVVDVYLVTHGHSEEAMYLASPFHAVKATGKAFRYRFEGADDERPFAILDDLASRGASDYLALHIGMQTPFQAGMSFTTAHPNGFPAYFQEVLQRLLPLIGRVIGFCLERLSLRELLSAYLGPMAARQVLNGQIVVGQTQSLHAVIGFADLIGLRRRVEDIPEKDHMAALSAFFSTAQRLVREAGGEILKLMGESLLFVARLEPDSASRVRNQALDAAQALSAAMTVEPSLAAYDLSVSVGLHEGEVVLGNVGAPSRLDFTVLGEAVNLAARLQSLGATQQESVVLSQTLAARMDRSFRSLGMVDLKGIRDPQEAVVPLGS